MRLSRKGAIALIVVLALALTFFLASMEGYRIDAVRSGSMSPVIKTGDLVITSPIDENGIHVGDVVTFHQGDMLICHRIVAINVSQGLIWTKGDANMNQDPYSVPFGNVVGEIHTCIPTSYAVTFMTSPFGFALIIVLGVLAYILGEDGKRDMGKKTKKVRRSLLERNRKYLPVFFALLLIFLVVDGGLMSTLSDTEMTGNNGIKAYTTMRWLQTTEYDFAVNTVSSNVETHEHPGQIELLDRNALGMADSFAILAYSTVTNTGDTVVTGDVGLSPGTSVVGFPPGTINGAQHVTDATAAQAQIDLANAYDFAAGRTPTAPDGDTLGGRNLTAGVYHGEAISLTGDLILYGSATDVWIFQAESTLITAIGSHVALSGGARAENVYWKVGSSATLGANSIFKGSILAFASITINNGASLEGRALARNGAVTLNANPITRPEHSASGWLNSSVFDTGIPEAKYNSIFWDANLPTETGLVFKARASEARVWVPYPDDPANGSWDLSGAWIVLSGTSWASLANLTGQYVQWRAELTTTDITKSPVLFEVRLYYSGF